MYVKPTAVDYTGALSGKKITMICGASGHILAIANDGLLYAWGRNDYVSRLLALTT
jgi:alpha-tubulin suppressor-like RCC1 family protein